MLVLAPVLAWAHSPNEAFQDIVDGLNKQNGTVPCSTCGLEAVAGNTKEPSPNKAYCDYLARYPLRDGEPSFKNYNDSLCNPSWPDGVKPWEKEGNKQLTTSFGTADYRPPSRADRARQGYSLLTAGEKEEYLTKANQIRERIAQSCCGEDKKCHSHLSKVSMKFCENPEADQDPNVPDRCSWSTGVFSVNTEGSGTFIKTLASTALNLNGMALSPAEKEYFQHLAGSAGKIDHSYVHTGEITFSPYGKNGTPEAKLYTVAHELGHACSNIRRQLLTNDENNIFAGIIATEAIKYMYYNKDPSYCSLASGDSKGIYIAVGDNIESSQKIMTCLYDLAKSSRDRSSSSYFENACPRRRLEEAWADAMAQLTYPDMTREDLIGRCNYLPSVIHPVPADTMSCALQYSAAFRAKANKVLACEAQQ